MRNKGENTKKPTYTSSWTKSTGGPTTHHERRPPDEDGPNQAQKWRGRAHGAPAP